jgi:hypothetical protein
VPAQYVELETAGLRGNGHMLIVEKNSAQIAAYVSDWLQTKLEVASPEPPPRKLPPFIKPLPSDAPVPSSNPRELRGMWMQLDPKPDQVLTLDGTPPPYTAAAEQLHNVRLQAEHSGKPFANDAVMCRPPGALWDLAISYFPIRFLQNDHEVVFLFERFHAVWRIAMNQTLPRRVRTSYMGHSVGHWEGDTLVVDTIGLHGGLWLDESGSTVSDAARLTSRIAKNAATKQLEIVTTIDDPRTYSRPWTLRQVLDWRPDYLVLSEHDCEEGAGSVQEAIDGGYTIESAR